MNAKVLKICAILIVTLAVLVWLRADGRYDFDIRSIIPFMRGPKITFHDWGGLVLIALAVWGIYRLRRPSPLRQAPRPPDRHAAETDEPVDELYDADPSDQQET